MRNHEKNVMAFSVIAGCVLAVIFCVVAAEAEVGQKSGSDKATAGNRTGKIVIRSLPLECDVSFLDQNIHKTEDQIIIEEIPVGSCPVVFKLGDEMLRAELDIQANATLLVNGHFYQGKVLVTPGISVGMDSAPMVLIPAGEFQMGSDFGEPDEMPVHTVYLDAFYMDVYEVTNAVYKRFLDATGHKAPRYWDDPRHNAPDQPAVGVNLHDAMAYCKWAGKRLPTEAEWEKGARGGLVGKIYPWGDEIPRGREADSGAGGNQQSGALPVGSFVPNGYGLHDMDGNAWEWCTDWYSETYYRESPDRNPTGPGSGEARVMRGGSWFANVYTPLSVSYRYSYDPDNTSDLIGLRCVK